MATASANGGESANTSTTSSPHRRPQTVTFSGSASEHVVEKAPSLVSSLGLTAYQQQQLVQSWPRIQRSGGHSSGAEIFRKLALKCTPVKETFQKANIVGRFARPPGYDIYKEHGKLLFDVLQLAIKSMNEPSSDELIELCTQYGAKHSALRGNGFQHRMWDDFSELLVEHIARSEAVRGRRESVRAWTTLIMFLVDKMKDGYDSALRKPLASSQQQHQQLQQQQSTIDDAGSKTEAAETALKNSDQK